MSNRELISRLRDVHGGSAQAILGSTIFTDAADALEALEPETDASLDTRMIAAGMIPLTSLLTDDPMGKFACHNAVRDMESFAEWLGGKHREYTRMRMQYELKDKPKDDLYEWVFAHSATFGEVVANFRQATSLEVE